MKTSSFPPVPKIKAEALGLPCGRQLGTICSSRLILGQQLPAPRPGPALPPGGHSGYCSHLPSPAPAAWEDICVLKDAQDHPRAQESSKHSPLPSDQDLSSTDVQFAPQLSLMTLKIKGLRREAQRRTHIPVPIFKPFCTPSVEKSDGYTSVVSMKDQVWVPQVHFCMDRRCIQVPKQPELLSSHYSYCSCVQLDPTDATYPCDRQLHAPLSG